MAKNLVIVESPAKAKTIEKFLGKDFKVLSSYGHVRDLAAKNLSVDVANNYQPQYEVSEDKKKIVAELKKEAKKAEMVWLATDEDREGEAISWHLLEALNLDTAKTKRIAFNEITEPAIKHAIQNPRDINIELVDAQQARRVLDRLVGFELSPVLWKKVKPSLSAGRVQSVTVRLIVEREREITDFVSVSSFKVSAEFNVGTAILKAELQKKLPDLKSAQDFLESIKGSEYTIEDLQKKPGKKSPAAPFTTSTLQQEAGRKLGFSVSRTMSVAQRLYESGKITYMRTDSVNLSNTAIEGAKEAILSMYGSEYANPKKYASKTKGAQEAHEAIRPTNFSSTEIEGSYDEQRLYDLIWKRTVASQMMDALFERTTVNIGVSKSDKQFVAQGEVLKFDGFLKVYIESSDDDEQEDSPKGMLPPITVGQTLDLKEVLAVERFTHHPPRYTEASLVKKLEELGIGRPSTYAPTISTVQKRGYVVKEEREGVERSYEVLSLKSDIVKKETKNEITGAEKNKLFPTDIGIVVNDFLVEHFKDIMDYNFTASVEKQFDDIAQGMLKWTKMIDEFYGPFHSHVENTLEHSEKATGARLLGTDPQSGKNVYARIGRFGPMIQIGEAEDEEKPKFASLRKEQSIQSITFEEAMDLFKLPRTLGEYEGKEVSVSIGRFGPYVKHGSLFASIKKNSGDDPMTIEIDRAIEIIKEKIQADKDKIIKVFKEDETLQILNGRWGPFLKQGKNNFKLPKDVEPSELTYDQCLEIIKNPPKKGGAKRKTKK
jgi:DNA topoisomerase I